MDNYLFYGFLISFVLTSFLFIIGIPILRNIKIGQNVRLDGPKSHYVKQGNRKLIILKKDILKLIIPTKIKDNDNPININIPPIVGVPCFT